MRAKLPTEKLFHSSNRNDSNKISTDMTTTKSTSSNGSLGLVRKNSLNFEDLKPKQPGEGEPGDNLNRMMRRSSMSNLGYKEQTPEGGGGGGGSGLVANRRRLIERRRSMETITYNKSPAPRTTTKKHLSYCETLPATTSQQHPHGDLSSGGSGHNSRFAALRERFNTSTSFDSSFGSLDSASRHSYSGNNNGSYGSLGMRSLSSASGSFGDITDSTDGDFRWEDEAKPLLEGSSFVVPTGAPDEEELKALALEARFNRTFLQVGRRSRGLDCRKTGGRGSFFMMAAADEKLANTKIVKNILDKAARKIQGFFRSAPLIKERGSNRRKQEVAEAIAARKIQTFFQQAMAIVKWYRKEMKYWLEVRKDIERLQQVEINDIQSWIELEKQQLRLQFGASTEAGIAGDGSNMDEVQQLKQELLTEKVERNQLKTSIHQLNTENHLLGRGDPILNYKIQQANQKIDALNKEQSIWKSVKGDLGTAKEVLEQKIDLMSSKQNEEQAQKQILEACITKVKAMAFEGQLDSEEKEEETKEMVARKDGEAKELVAQVQPTTLVRQPSVESTKPTLPTLTRVPTGSANDFSSGRKEKFDDIYTLGKMLGEGAFGEVFVCVHKELQVERAVKVINKALMSDWELEDCIKEFQMLTSFDNPNVIRVYEFYDTDETFYMVQELAQGGELFDEWEKHGKLKEQDVALLMKNILACTNYLAENNVVHRDINLENILLNEPGNYNSIKLIDFGLAARCPPGGKLFDLVGKPRYLAPEVLGDDGYSLGYDVWSCGIIAAILLTGYFPFDSDNDMDVYNQIVDGYINYDHQDWHGISDQAKSFVQELLTYEEGARPSAGEALKHPWITGNTSGEEAVGADAAAQVWIAPSLSTTKMEECSLRQQQQEEEEKAARIIQRFFRCSKVVFDKFREEEDSKRKELEDVERRQKNELQDIQRHLKVQKQEMALLFEEALLKELGEELESNRNGITNLEKDVAMAEAEQEFLNKQICDLTQANKLLEEEILCKEQAPKLKNLKRKVKKLEDQKIQCEAVADQYKRAIDIIRVGRMGGLKASIQREQSTIEKIKECMGRIVELVERKLGQKDPKLVKKIKNTGLGGKKKVKPVTTRRRESRDDAGADDSLTSSEELTLTKAPAGMPAGIVGATALLQSEGVLSSNEQTMSSRSKDQMTTQSSSCSKQSKSRTTKKSSTTKKATKMKKSSSCDDAHPKLEGSKSATGVGHRWDSDIGKSRKSKVKKRTSSRRSTSQPDLSLPVSNTASASSSTSASALMCLITGKLDVDESKKSF